MNRLFHSCSINPRVILCLLFLSGLLFAQSSNDPVKPPEILDIKPIPTEKPNPEDGRYYSPLFIQMPNGPLHAFSIRTMKGHREEAMQTSTDDGRTWSAPVTAFQLPDGIGEVGGPQLLLDKQGQIHFFFLVNPHPTTTADFRDQNWNIWYVRSLGSGGGVFRWTPAKEIWRGYAGSLLSGIQLSSGRLVLPLCFLTKRSWSERGTGPDAFTFHGLFSSSVLYSDNGGETWQQSPDELKTETPDLTTIEGAIEPIILQLKDGRVWMLLRTQMGRFYESFSADGVRWSRPQPSGIIASDSPAALVRLRDGRILMIWNNCLRYAYAYGGRHVLHAAVSEDEGRTWRGYREIVRDPERVEPPPPNTDFGVSYSLPSVLSDGKVIVGFGYYREVPGVLLDPRWLYETKQREEFLKGLENWSTFGTRGAEVVAHPDGADARVLSLRKPDVKWLAAAVWNFPAGIRGQLRLRLLLKPGFKPINIGLTDHFSPPFDELDRFNNLYNLSIDQSGQFAESIKLETGRWYGVDLEWDNGKGECRVIVDKRQVAVVAQSRRALMTSYLRLRSMAVDTDDAGMLVESLEAAVVPR